MELAETQKNLIRDIIDKKLKNYYYYQDQETLECILLDEEKRSKLGQFYTPAEVCIKMINMYKTETVADKNVLDPCCGSGNLLIAMLCAGADTNKIFGNEYDADAVKICIGRIKQALKLLGRDLSEFNDWQIHQGNALQARCLLEFGPSYSGDKEHPDHYQAKYIDDLEYAQTYDHEEEIEDEFLGFKNKTTKKHYAKSWRWENENAAKRKKAEEAKKAAREEIKNQYNALFEGEQ